MSILSPDEASVLALLAQHPNAPASKRRELLKLLGPEGKDIAEAMRTKGRTATSQRAVDTARGLIRWAGGNGTMRSNSGEILVGQSGITHRIVVGDKRDSSILLGQTSSPKKTRRTASPPSVRKKK